MIPYGDRTCVAGDIVELILNLTSRQIQYTLNGKSQGIAFENIEDCSYIVGVYINKIRDSVEVLSYETCDL